VIKKEITKRKRNVSKKKKVDRICVQCLQIKLSYFKILLGDFAKIDAIVTNSTVNASSEK
jgi:hypothetical protein